MPLILSGSAGLSGNVGTTTKEMLPAGSVLQVVQVVKSDTWVNTSNNNYLEIPGLVASITPFSATSKILINVSLGSVSAYSAAIRMLKNGSVMSGSLGQTAGSRPGMTARTTYTDANHPDQMSFTYMDVAGGTAAINYGIGAAGYNGYGFYLNRSVNDSDLADTYGGRSISTITLTEIKA